MPTRLRLRVHPVPQRQPPNELREPREPEDPDLAERSTRSCRAFMLPQPARGRFNPEFSRGEPWPRGTPPFISHPGPRRRGAGEAALLPQARVRPTAVVLLSPSAGRARTEDGRFPFLLLEAGLESN